MPFRAAGARKAKLIDLCLAWCCCQVRGGNSSSCLSNRRLLGFLQFINHEKQEEGCYLVCFEESCTFRVVEWIFFFILNLQVEQVPYVHPLPRPTERRLLNFIQLFRASQLLKIFFFTHTHTHTHTHKNPKPNKGYKDS